MTARTSFAHYDPADTAPVDLRALVQAAVEAQDTLNGLCAAHMPLPAESILSAAEDRFYTARRALLDHLLMEHNVGARLAADLGRVL